MSFGCGSSSAVTHDRGGRGRGLPEGPESQSPVPLAHFRGTNRDPQAICHRKHKKKQTTDNKLRKINKNQSQKTEKQKQKQKPEVKAKQTHHKWKWTKKKNRKELTELGSPLQRESERISQGSQGKRGQVAGGLWEAGRQREGESQRTAQSTNKTGLPAATGANKKKQWGTQLKLKAKWREQGEHNRQRDRLPEMPNYSKKPTNIWVYKPDMASFGKYYSFQTK